MAVREIYAQMCRILAQNPNSDARFEADMLVEFVLGRKRIDVMGDEISENDAQRLISYAQRRREGFPLQYMLGRWYFLRVHFSPIFPCFSSYFSTASRINTKI